MLSCFGLLGVAKFTNVSGLSLHLYVNVSELCILFVIFVLSWKIKNCHFMASSLMVGGPNFCLFTSFIKVKLDLIQGLFVSNYNE